MVRIRSAMRCRTVLILRLARHRAENRSEIHIRCDQRDVLGGSPRYKDVPRRTFVIHAQIARFASIFHAGSRPPVEDITERAFEFDGIAIVPIATESQQAELIRLRVSRDRIHDNAAREKHFRGGQIKVGAVVIFRAELRGAREPRQTDRGRILDSSMTLVLHAGRHLWNPQVLRVDRIADQPHL